MVNDDYLPIRPFWQQGLQKQLLASGCLVTSIFAHKKGLSLDSPHYTQNCDVIQQDILLLAFDLDQHFLILCIVPVKPHDHDIVFCGAHNISTFTGSYRLD